MRRSKQYLIKKVLNTKEGNKKGNEELKVRYAENSKMVEVLPYQ